MLNRQFKFTSNKYEKIKISLILMIILVFILMFLKPFDMFIYIPKNKWYLYFGYGISLFLAHLIIIFIEDRIYHKQERRWYIKNEIFVKLLYFIIGSVIIYFYHFLFVKTFQRPWTGFPVFVLNYTLPFFLIFVPLMVIYRNLKGEFYKEGVKEVNFEGTNKSERFTLKQKDILFSRSENNYVFIYYLDDDLVKKIMLRNTLSKIQKQAPFLIKSHRSYLVNPARIESLKGKSQNATLQLKSFDEKIPVSKTYFNSIQDLKLKALD
ncbi:MAG: LytTR family DNA-binding domain-containing protein [Bacteroidota bacterium]